MEISERDGIPDHLTCLLRNLYAGQEATVRIGCGTTDWFQIGKGVCQGCILSTSLFNLYAEPIPYPEDVPDPGIKSESPGLQTDSLSAELPQKALLTMYQS